MVRIGGVATVLPDQQYPQEEITAAFAEYVLPGRAPDDPQLALLERFHAACAVRTRSMALPLADYARLADFGEANDAFLRVGTDLGERAVRRVLAQVGLEASDIDLIMTVSVTGIGAPSIDARLVGRLGMRSDVKRLPVFGLGCVAGVAGLARLNDLLGGDPDGVAVLLSVELCSLTVQREDASLPNLVASGLFGDGAAAVIVLGERKAQQLGLGDAPQIVATRSRFYPDTERVMGWDIGASGFRIVLAATVADVVEQHLGDDVDGFLADSDLKRGDIERWVAHPGGPKVLEAVQRTLGLPREALSHTWDSLAETGNLSSASVLSVLERTLAGPRPAPGAPGVMLAMGPGFCAELVLLRWP